MALPLQPAEFSRQSAFEVREDRGVRGKLDREDVVVKDGSADPVDWSDADFEVAREQAVKELILDPQAKFLQQIGEGLKPDQKDPQFDSRRPGVEIAITVLRQLLDDAELPGSIRSQACLGLAGFEGKLASNDGDTELGKVSFGHLTEAHELDANNAIAWGMYGITVLSFAHRSWVMQKLISCRRGLNIDIDDELKLAVTNLNRLRESPEAQCYLHVILSDRVRAGEASAVDRTLLASVEKRLAAFRADPEIARGIDDLTKNPAARVATFDD